MVRRDQFVQNVSDNQSIDVLNSDADRLERFIDSKLQEEIFLIDWTNSHEFNSTSGIEELSLNQTNWRAVHHDPTSQNPVSGFSSNGYAIYDENVLTQDSEPADQTPWFDRTFSFEPSKPVLIILPKNTKVNAARIVAVRYKNRGIGYWDHKPELGNDLQPGTSGTIMVDSVKLFWDHSINRFYLEFNLS